MQQTLIAVFDNRGDAQKAQEELVACGYPRETVRLSEGDAAGDASRAQQGAARAAGDNSFTSGIRLFFSELFGTDRSEPAQMYSEAVSRGNYVLTLTADSLPEVERAADIVERFGPIDIDEHAELWRGAKAGQESMRAGAGTMQQSQPGSQQFAQGQPGAQQRAETTAIPVIQEELKVGKRQVERGGVRIYQRVLETPVSESVGLRETAEEAVIGKTARVVEEVVVGKEVRQRTEKVSDKVRRTEVEAEQLAPDDEAYFRGHWTSNFAGDGATYEDYAPAYTYGSTMARSDLYRGRPWNEVEHNLRSDWEARNPGSAWAKVKAAIRHGWERITS